MFVWLFDFCVILVGSFSFGFDLRSKFVFSFVYIFEFFVVV